MLKFPDEINVNNKSFFEVYNSNRILTLLRSNIYDMILSRDTENEYFDIDEFCFKTKYKQVDLLILLDKVIKELNEFGWKTQLSFGDTGLFIYSTENKPSSCW